MPILRAGNIQDSLNTETNLVFVPPALVRSEQNMRQGDFAICMSSGSPAVVGKSALLERDWHGSVGAFCAIIRFGPELNHRFGAYWFRSPAYLRWRDKHAKGANIQNLRREEVEKLQLPVPPLAEQERIVELLDEADALRKLRAEADRRTAELIPALFHEMFGDPVDNPMGWPTECLGSVGRLDRGRSKHRPRDAPSLYGGPYPFIQTGDVARSNGRITTFVQTYSEEGLSQSRLWPEDTLVITIAANIGKTAILTFPACFPDSLVGFVPSRAVNVEFVRQWLATRERFLDASAPQMAQKNINLQILKNLTLPIPPMKLQDQFAAHVSNNYGIESGQTSSRHQLHSLNQSLLRLVFDEGYAS